MTSSIPSPMGGGDKASTASLASSWMAVYREAESGCWVTIVRGMRSEAVFSSSFMSPIVPAAGLPVEGLLPTGTLQRRTLTRPRSGVWIKVEAQQDVVLEYIQDDQAPPGRLDAVRIQSPPIVLSTEATASLYSGR